MDWAAALLTCAQEKRPLMEGYVRGVLVTWWWYRIGYVIALCFVKLSILSFYKTITTNRVLRHLVTGTAGFVIAYTFGATLAAIFQCRTPSDAWSTAAFFAQFDKVPDPNAPHVDCYDPTLFFLATAGLNLFSDIVILLLPIPMLLGLQVPRRQRIAVAGIFSIGLMAIVASAVRVHVMRMWAISPVNSTKYGNSLLLWGQVEANSGIISASVPFMRLLFRRGKEGTNRGLRRVQEIQPPKLSKSDNSHDMELDEMTLVHGEPDLEAGSGGKRLDEKSSLTVTTGKKNTEGDDLDNLKPTSPRMLT
jgi:hypothetical protein